MYNADTTSHAYNNFLLTIHNCISNAVPTKSACIGGGNPEFGTPLITSLLNKRYNLRKQGKLSEADVLTAKINVMISVVRKKSTP